MGSMAGKLSECLNTEVNSIEILMISNSVQDCYNEVQKPFKIRSSIEPDLHIPKLTLPRIYESPELQDKDFPVFSMTAEQLTRYSLEIFKDAGFNLEKVNSAISLVAKNYFTTTPFHNFWHGFSVMQGIYVIGQRNSQLDSFLLRDEYFYLLFSAIGHDLCHPGLNNSFLIATKHEVALKYNGVSVLENHHAAVLLEILKKSEVYEENQLKSIKNTIIGAIISTDMTKHKQCCDDFATDMESFDINDKKKRQSFMNYILHCSDLGNQALHFNIASIWSLKILQEFNQQVALEEDKKIKVSEFMKIGCSIEKIKNSQVGVINAIVYPLWKMLSQHIPNIEDFPRTVKKNKKKWERFEGFGESS